VHFRTWLLALTALLLTAVVPATASAAAPSSAARSAAAFRDVAGRPAPARSGARPDIQPRRFRGLALDHAALGDVLTRAPRGRSAAPLVVTLPAPDGRDRRFAVRKTPVMEPALAAAHPEIATYSGAGIDDPGTTVHLDLTPLGLHAAVRGPGGSWYLDPYYHGERSLYASYRGADVVNPHGSFLEGDVPSGGRPRLGSAPRIDGAPVQLRTYRLALVSDPAYATFHGAANVTAAKVTLVNRVNQVYEDDLAIRLTLVAGNDALNLDTAAQMTGANGPCGAAPCYSALQAADCNVGTLDQTRIVLGQLIGASSYDIGHIGMGLNGGGVAYLGVVGGDLKGGGCTGVDQPVGDLFAVDYVAHEIGHQFAGDHTFNGVAGSCAGNGATGASVEPGSGSTIMAYAGICGTDDLQPHSDPYFSQRSIDEISAYVALAPATGGEVQTVSLRGFTGTDAFRLTYNGVESGAITRGANYTAAGIKAAIEAILPAGAIVTVRQWNGAVAAPGDTGFSVRFGGSLAGTDAAPLTLTSPAGVTGFVGATAQGGPSRNGGDGSPTGNTAPVVAAPAGFTIPARTPFSLSGSATDADGDALTYLWEQNDSGAGKSLVSNTKPSGPLFRVFGTAAQVSPTDTLTSPSPGENVAGTSPARVFPDLAQVVAGNTNAADGTCPAAGPAPVAAAIVDCYSEFLPTSAYADALHFRLTARDGRGGVARGDTTLALAKTAGPFRVSSQAAATSVEAGAPFPVTWDRAGTDVAPVNTASVRITLSTDGGRTFPRIVSAATPNDGAQTVILPNANTAQARIRVEAVGNVFFDVNRADFTIVPGAPVVSTGGATTAQYSDAPPVTVSATDENSPGSALTATAAGLPTGLALVPGAPSAGARSWTLGGAADGAPGTYPVEVTVDDGAGHVGIGAFDVVVTPEDAGATYTGDTLVSSGPATLRFSVQDSSDASAGDVANATVTFVEGSTTLCSAVPVTTTGDATTGTASCIADLAPGATHHIDAVIGGRYSGTGASDVEVAGAAVPAGPAAPVIPAPLTLPAPLATPTAAALAPDLAKATKRLRLSRAGRVAVALRCRTIGTGRAPATCTGTLKLTARVGGRRQTVGTARFSFARATTRSVSIKLGAKARRALKRATAATLTATVANAAGGARTATKSVTLVPLRAT
jgi:hypothetical protein